MAHIIDAQGSHLNKWKSISVDYFSREKDWSDYRELVQRPANYYIEFHDNAISGLYSATSGNPYFTKLLCQFIFQNAVSKSDCHVTTREVDQAIEFAVVEVDKNTFQHFWEDGIIDMGERANEKSIQRRKLLIAVSDVVVDTGSAQQNLIAAHPLSRDIPSMESELSEFVSRKVLIADSSGKAYEFKVKLFEKWLKRRGISDLIATFANLDAVLRMREEEERLRVSSKELVDLVSNWGTYKGQTITEDKVRAWLVQFGGPREQRAMFNLLKGIRFYKDKYIREKMSEVDSIVRRGLKHRIEEGRAKRSDILVSYLDGVSKSGARFARIFADEASIYVDNIIEKGKLLHRISNDHSIKALVFIDDFVGTGNSLAAYLEQMDLELSKLLIEKGIKVVCVAVVACQEGVKAIQERIPHLNVPIDFHYLELLNEQDKAFSESSRVFPEPQERDLARRLALQHGKLLEKDHPLGYGDLEALVVFEQNCPNNNLPILYKDSIQHKWTAIFKRH